MVSQEGVFLADFVQQDALLESILSLEFCNLPKNQIFIIFKVLRGVITVEFTLECTLIQLAVP